MKRRHFVVLPGSAMAGALFTTAAADLPWHQRVRRVVGRGQHAREDALDLGQRDRSLEQRRRQRHQVQIVRRLRVADAALVPDAALGQPLVERADQLERDARAAQLAERVGRAREFRVHDRRRVGRVATLLEWDDRIPPFEVVHAEAFKAAVRKFAEALQKHPLPSQTLPTYGTNVLANIINEAGGYPTRNFSSGTFEQSSDLRGEHMREVILARQGKIGTRCMPGCVIACRNLYVDEAGNPIVGTLQYETIALMGANLGLDNLDDVARLNYMCNDFGLDTIETGAALGVAIAVLSFVGFLGTFVLVRSFAGTSGAILATLALPPFHLVILLPGAFPTAGAGATP